MLNRSLLLIISRWIMLWNETVFCLEVLIYKRLHMWRHNDVIGRNEYLISTWSESTVPWVYSLQFLFKSMHHSWRYERKCEWVFFFWTQCIINYVNVATAYYWKHSQNVHWCRQFQQEKTLNVVDFGVPFQQKFTHCHYYSACTISA